MRHKTFRLSALIFPLLPVWMVAWGLGILTAVSVIGLLVVSGWFVTLAGMVGMAFGAGLNYFSLSPLIGGLAMGRTLGRYGDLMVSHYAIFDTLKKLRVRFFNQFAHLPINERLAIGSATAQYRLVKDIDTLNEFPLKVISPMVVVAVVLLLASVGLYGAFGFVPIWAVLVFVLVFVFMATAKKFAQTSTHLQENRQTYLINALPLITQLVLWEKWQSVVDSIGKQDLALSAIHARQSRHNMLAMLSVQSILIASLLVVLAMGIEMWAAERVSMSVMLLLGATLGFLALMEVVATLTTDTLVFAKTTLAKNRLNAILGQDAPKQLQPIPTNFNIVIKNLSAYQKDAIFGLDNVNITIQQGVPLVIFGVSGGGKSTLLQTLAGELMPKAGEIVLETDNTDTKIAMSGVDWQDKLGFLGQQVDIFDRSLADNLRLGKPDACDDELLAVLELVGLKAWVDDQPKGLDTPLGEYGKAISGGQARRIALARLLLSPKKVLLLDEPFAGLDSANRDRLWQVLQERQQHGHLIVVSHHQLGGVFNGFVVGR